jgi:hypothetical protein
MFLIKVPAEASSFTVKYVPKAFADACAIIGEKMLKSS